MGLFAKFSRKSNDKPSLGPKDAFVIREAEDRDVPELAQIAAEREGDSASAQLSSFQKLLRQNRQTGRALALVGELAKEIIGFAKATYFSPPPDPLPNIAPEGWYLGGVVVAPRFRRRGVANQLTHMRLEWTAQRSSCAYYFVNERNTVSIDLHRHFGFVELTRDFSFPGATFEGGSGILFKLDLRNWRKEHPQQAQRNSP